MDNRESASDWERVLSQPLAGLVRDLWQRIRLDWSFASDALSRTFRQNRSLSGADRRRVAETLYGMIRQLRRLDAALRVGGHSGAGAAPDTRRLLAYLVLEAGMPPEEARRRDGAIDWEAVQSIDQRLEATAPGPERLARRRSLPDWLAAALWQELGPESDALAAALNERAPMTVRVNALVTDRDALIRDLAEEGIEAAAGQYSPLAVHVRSRTNLFGLRGFKKGHFEAQDEGSQLIAELVAPPPRSMCIDYCAGAGGKTLALAAAMDNRGRILAADVDDRKLAELRRRARRAGVDTVQAVRIDADDAAPWPRALQTCAGTAKRVLVDAPCTGIGALRRNPEARWRLTEADRKRMPELQMAIAERALGLVGPGGRLIYATCTVLEAENEGVIARLMQRHPELEVVPIREILGAERALPLQDDSGRFLRTYPHRHGTDGFFAAVLRRPKAGP